MFNAPISPGYWLINTHMCLISPTFQNHNTIYVTLSFITRDSWCQVGKKYKTSWMTRSSSYKLWLMTIGKIMIWQRRHWRNMRLNVPISRQSLHSCWFRINITRQPSCTHQITKTLTLQSHINKKSPPLEGGNCLKTRGMWNLNNETRLQFFLNS